MFANRFRGPVANALRATPRVARPRNSALSRLRTYSNVDGPLEDRSASSSQWLRNSLKLVGFAGLVFLGYTGYTYYATTLGLQDEAGSEGTAKAIRSSRQDLGSQFVQLKRNLKSPGVYLWGSNKLGVVDPDSKDSVVKTPRRLSYFDGQVLRDLKLDDRSAAAITENGDLVQWGKGFSETDFKPTKTLTGKDLVSVSMSDDRIIALSSSGTVYSLPLARADQQSGQKLRESSWFPFWSEKADVSYRLLSPALRLGEKVTAISGGLEHALLLTNYGRVFSVASATEHYPSHGQLGIPGLTWATRPKGPVDACHEITTLKNVKASHIAAGDYHSMVLANNGHLYMFGSNSYGQLAMEFCPEFPLSDTPTAVSLDRLYRGSNWPLKVTKIAAGGANSFFTVDVKRTLRPGEDPSTVRDLGLDISDTWACGRGIWGTIGNGRWTHLQDAPTKLKSLSGLFEFDERTNKLSPIRLRDLSIGTTHAAAVMDNRAHLEFSSDEALDRPGNWGFDALWWGGNEFYQLGTGKRTNLSKPTYINAPAEPGDKDKREARLQVMPLHKTKIGSRTVTTEQRVECGRHVSAIYSAV